MAGKPFDLEAMRSILGDKRLHLAIGKVVQLSEGSDKAILKVLVSLYPDSREIVARMTWDAVGPEAGIFFYPVIGDQVLVAFAEGDFNQAFVIRRLTSVEDKIPARASEGHAVIKALAGKKTFITGAQVQLTKGDAPGTEPLVLGLVLIAGLTELVGKFDSILSKLIAGPIGMGNLGAPVPTFPALVADLTTIQTDLATIKETYLESADTNIVSTFAFTERGQS